jgi:chromosome segregation ATPase
MFDDQPKPDVQAARVNQQVAELRAQLLQCAREVDERRRRLREQVVQIEEQRGLIEKQRQEIDALSSDAQAWRTFRESRAHRILVKYRSIYDAPLIGGGIRAARRFLGRLRSR